MWTTVPSGPLVGRPQALKLCHALIPLALTRHICIKLRRGQRPDPCMHYKLSGPDLGLNFHPYVLQITAYNRRTFETARNNLVINIMATEGESLGMLTCCRYWSRFSLIVTLHFSSFFNINKASHYSITPISTYNIIGLHSTDLILDHLKQRTCYCRDYYFPSIVL